MKVVWRERARADIHVLIAYIARDKPKAALRTHDRITRMIGYLADWPDLGISRKAGVRELVVPRTPYIVIYRREADKIIIQRVLHGCQKR